MYIRAVLVREFMPVIALIVLAVVLCLDTYTDRRTKKLFSFLIFLELIEILVYELEYWTQSFETFHYSRLVFSVIGYDLRPILITLFVLIASKKRFSVKRKLLLLIPSFLNILIMTSALFSPLTFYFSEDNHWHSGPLSYTTHITAAIYYCVLLYLCISEHKLREHTEQLILLISTIFLILVTLIDVIFDAEILRAGIAITTFSFYFSVQNRNQLSLIEDLHLLNERNSIVISQSNKSIALYDLENNTLSSFANNSGDIDITSYTDNLPESLIDAGVILPESIDDIRIFFANMHSNVDTGRKIFHVKKTEDTAIWVQCDYTIQRDKKGIEKYSIISLSDITAEYENLEALQQVNESLELRANYDALTGLYSRSVVMEMISDYLNNEGANGTHALLMLDMDNLKSINDNLGHQVGDTALKRFAEVLKDSFGSDDIRGRIGGDEFFVFLKNIYVDTTVNDVKDMLRKFEFTFTQGNISVKSTASIGITIYDGSAYNSKTNEANMSKSLEQLYNEALYRSKKAGKNCVTLY